VIGNRPARSGFVRSTLSPQGDERRRVEVPGLLYIALGVGVRGPDRYQALESVASSVLSSPGELLIFVLFINGLGVELKTVRFAIKYGSGVEDDLNQPVADAIAREIPPKRQVS